MTTYGSLAGLKIREVCGLCDRRIQIGQPTVVCGKCDKIFHGKCVKSSNNNFTAHKEKVFCEPCMAQYDLIQYNPFIELICG